ncbi:hypothetical protein CEXT_221121 [Caerostris extrusa]|uniref:Uncharacterized protein n=1 Tax=Caerostris extrusa TaxID=172846 RepID=A0AAV4ME24_CAEEX|nr:hypothetical protein CEXT_221121 [Caerostris extrusa]
MEEIRADGRRDDNIETHFENCIRIVFPGLMAQTNITPYHLMCYKERNDCFAKPVDPGRQEIMRRFVLLCRFSNEVDMFRRVSRAAEDSTTEKLEFVSRSSSAQNKARDAASRGSAHLSSRLVQTLLLLFFSSCYIRTMQINDCLAKPVDPGDKKI